MAHLENFQRIITYHLQLKANGMLKDTSLVTHERQQQQHNITFSAAPKKVQLASSV